MLSQADNKIEKELDVIKIIKDLKNIQILIQKSGMDPLTKYIVAHSSKNIINLNTTEHESSSCECGEGEKLEEIKEYILKR